MWKTKENSRTWMVEHDFIETRWGRRPMWIKTGFKTELEAEQWCKENTNDGEVLWMEETEWVEE